MAGSLSIASPPVEGASEAATDASLPLSLPTGEGLAQVYIVIIHPTMSDSFIQPHESLQIHCHQDALIIFHSPCQPAIAPD